MKVIADLFVIGDIGLRAVSKLLKEPCGKIGREINPHVMSRVEFLKRRAEKDHFMTRVLESPIIMIIGDENDLKKLSLIKRQIKEIGEQSLLSRLDVRL